MICHPINTALTLNNIEEAQQYNTFCLDGGFKFDDAYVDYINLSFSNFTDKFNDTKLQGESLSFKHANVIIVADKNESLRQWQRTINDNITWQI